MTMTSRRSIWSRLFVLLCLSVSANEAIQWLALSVGSRDPFWNRTNDCSESRTVGLLKDQRLICRRNLELMPVVVRASRQVVDICQELFADRRWNCSSVQLAPNYMADLTGGSREQAYLYALSAASLTQAIAKACSSGASAKCSCGPLPNEPPPGEFKWGGCGDDVGFGVIFSKWFTDTPWNKKKNSKRHLVNIHNNAVGRQMVSESLAPTCKCHGVSGSCSIKTCWKALPDIRQFGLALQKRYATALEVNARTERRSRQRSLVAVQRNRRSVAEDELVYYTISPDYCLPDKSLGSIGTRGRECQKDHPGSGGCRSMCCGRGYTVETVQVRHRCDCKYYWCCYVKCSTCTKKVDIYRCR
jgi:wingless-type MMTV integration site family protein 11